MAGAGLGLISWLLFNRGRGNEDDQDDEDDEEQYEDAKDMTENPNVDQKHMVQNAHTPQSKLVKAVPFEENTNELKTLFTKMEEKIESMIQQRWGALGASKLISEALDHFEAFSDRVTKQVTSKAQRDAAGKLLSENAGIIKKMYQMASNWKLMCKQIMVPEFQPQIAGISDSVNVIKNSLMGSAAFHEASPVFMLHGPAGSGKTIQAFNVAYEMKNTLVSSLKTIAKEVQSSLEAFPPGLVPVPNVQDAPYVQLREIENQISRLPLFSFYYVDALDWRRKKTPMDALKSIQSLFECLQLEARYHASTLGSLEDTKSASWLMHQYSEIRPTTLVVLDNLDVLFEKESELAKEGRKGRPQSRLKGFVYIPLEGPNDEKQPRVGGAGGEQTSTDAQMQYGDSNFIAEFQALFDLTRLRSEYPDLRWLWNVRKPWMIPSSIQKIIGKNNRRFVDLPNQGLRMQIATNWIRQLALKQWLSWINRLRRMTEPQRITQFVYEINSYKNLKQELKDKDPSRLQELEFIRDLVIPTGNVGEENNHITNDWNQTLTIETLARLILVRPQMRKRWGDLEAAQKIVLQTIVDQTGMNAEGGCKLAQAFPPQDLKLFLRVYDKSNALDYKSTVNMSVKIARYGFTIEEEIALMEAIEKKRSQDMLMLGLEEIQGRISNTLFSSEGCKYLLPYDQDEKFEPTAKCDYILDRNLVVVKGKGSRTSKGEVMLPVLLPGNQSPLPTGFTTTIFPLSVQYGSHRFVLPIGETVLAFKNSLTPQDDYLDYVSYMLKGAPLGKTLSSMNVAVCKDPNALQATRAVGVAPFDLNTIVAAKGSFSSTGFGVEAKRSAPQITEVITTTREYRPPHRKGGSRSRHSGDDSFDKSGSHTSGSHTSGSHTSGSHKSKDKKSKSKSKTH